MNDHIAVYGAAFNPPHRGHCDVIQQIKDDFDTILLIPSIAHAFGKKMQDYVTRIKMLELIIQEFFPHQSQIEICKIEQYLHQQHPDQAVYTYDVLYYLQTLYPQSRLTFIIGPDNAKPQVWQRFYRHQDIIEQFSLRIISERIAIRSSDCRHYLHTHTHLDKLPEYCGQALSHYIQQHQFYQ